MNSAGFRRLYSMSAKTSSAPFSRAVVNAIRRLYPEQLAERSWDNTGLLLEAPYNPRRRQKNSVLLTVDLTKAVADEAIERHDSIVIAYHPIIFRGLKSLTLADSQQESLLRLAAEGISVYSPHTAIDAATGGLGDWLADIITSEPSGPRFQRDGLQLGDTSGKNPGSFHYGLTHLSPTTKRENASLKLNSLSHSRSTIRPLSSYSSTPSIPGHDTAGMGRLVRFHQPQTLLSIIHNISLALGLGQSPTQSSNNSHPGSTPPIGFPLAIPQSKTLETITDISSVGICAGSGGSLFASSPTLSEVDLLFTGEMSHHEALAATERGQCVIAPFHSNTERGFLSGVMRRKLGKEILDEWQQLGELELPVVVEEKKSAYLEAYVDKEVRVDVSERDRDPYGIVFASAGVTS